MCAKKEDIKAKEKDKTGFNGVRCQVYWQNSMIFLKFNVSSTNPTLTEITEAQVHMN